MLKLWKVNAKAGDATVKYPFAPFPTNKDMRGKPEHNAELCIACGACGVACPADAIRMDTDLVPIPSPGRSTTVVASSAAAARKPAPWRPSSSPRSLSWPS